MYGSNKLLISILIEIGNLLHVLEDSAPSVSVVLPTMISANIVKKNDMTMSSKWTAASLIVDQVQRKIPFK